MNEHSRRNFIKTAIGTVAAAGLFHDKLFAETNSIIAKTVAPAKLEVLDPNSVIHSEPVFIPEAVPSPDYEFTAPKALKPGSIVAITAPASPVASGELSASIKYFKDMGCKVEIGDTIAKQKNQYRYFSAPDKDRAAEFMSYVNRKDVDMILCGRGGYGVMRILPMLDYAAIKNNPKIIMGFSDITALLLAVNRQSNLITFHGPVGSSSNDSYRNNMVSQLLTSTSIKKGVKYPISEMEIINPGKACGIIQGGNLRIISSTMGTPYEINTHNSILFIEDVSEHAYEIDRMLTQLAISGKFDTCKAIIFGKFKNLNVRRPFFPNKGYSIREVIEQVIKPLNIPTVIGLPFGHLAQELTFPLGVAASFDTNSKSIELLQAAVS